jgi:hypothetical protein
MLLRTLLLLLVAGLTQAADFTITVTIDDAKAKDVLAVATAWRAQQLDPDGNPKYSTNAALGEAILIDALRRIIRDQCEFDPANCPAWGKTHLDAKTAAEQGIRSEIDDAVK